MGDSIIREIPYYKNLILHFFEQEYIQRVSTNEIQFTLSFPSRHPSMRELKKLCKHTILPPHRNVIVRYAEKTRRETAKLGNAQLLRGLALIVKVSIASSEGQLEELAKLCRMKNRGDFISMRLPLNLAGGVVGPR
jgi:hypothetical protein